MVIANEIFPLIQLQTWKYGSFQVEELRTILHF